MEEDLLVDCFLVILKYLSLCHMDNCMKLCIKTTAKGLAFAADTYLACSLKTACHMGYS
jgi:hypothetical protein